MLFNTLDFAIFFIVIYSVFWIIPNRFRNHLLLLCSYVFYGSWNYKFLALIFISTVVDYFCGLNIDRATDSKVRKRYLLVSIAVNLSFLAFFKYFNFFAESFVELLQLFNLNASFSLLNIILPVGISFYTFQTMSYTIDIYRGELKPTRNFLNFALFVSYFPQLVAGPIERAKKLLPQIEGSKVITVENVKKGIWLILLGYFKKVFIADNCAVVANTVFSQYESLNGFANAVGVLAFAFQIYNDFSGYSDIARGVSKLFGIELMTNFRMPYFSKSPSEFWRRWHISLSSWLRDYLYIPLGGNRKGATRTHINLMLTMLLGGLWHGASWNFVLWGAYQGALLVGYGFFKNKSTINLPRFVRMALFFVFTCYGWLLFRGESYAQIQTITLSFFRDFWPTSIALGWLKLIVYYNFLLLIIQHAKHKTEDMYVVLKIHPTLRYGLYGILLTFITLLGKYEAVEFIYFQF